MSWTAGYQPLFSGGVDENGVFITVPRTEITLRGEHATKTVVVGDNGFYQADLPVGVYKMTAQSPKVGPQTLRQFSRMFRITSPAKIVLNGNLYDEEITSCDALGFWFPRGAVGGDEDNCGGEDRFPLLSKDGTPFELYIRFRHRSRTDRGYAYAYGARRYPEHIPVFVAYNLFSLEAGGVSYDSKNHMIVAVGNVVTEDGSGKTQHFDSIGFRVEDGRATPIMGAWNDALDDPRNGNLQIQIPVRDVIKPKP